MLFPWTCYANTYYTYFTENNDDHLLTAIAYTYDSDCFFIAPD